MGVNGKLIVVDDPHAEKSERAHLLLNAFVFSQWFHSPLQIVAQDFSKASLASSIAKEVGAESLRVEWVALGEGRNFEKAVVDDVINLECALIILSLTQKEKKMGHLEGWKTKLLEASQSPVLIYPPRYELKRHGFESFFVPMSGEMSSNTALDWAIRKGNQLNIPVDVFHVTEDAHDLGRGRDRSMVGMVSDQYHHEYPSLVQQFISQASPYTSMRQKLVIREFLHVTGNPLKLLSEQMSKRIKGLFVVEWKGQFVPGRALLVKHMIAHGKTPILLVRQRERALSKLKVAGDFEAA